MNTHPLTSLTSPLDDRQLTRLHTALVDLSPLQMAWISGYLAGLSGPTVAANQAPETAGTTATGPTLTILFGSQTGHARGVAESLAALVRARGLEPRLSSMADYRPRDLARERLLLVVVSTQGEGEPPESARELHAFLHGKRVTTFDATPSPAESPHELIKARSNLLRGTLRDSLADELTGGMGTTHEAEILATLDGLFARYAAARHPQEGFGDFVVRAGIVRPVETATRACHD